MLFEQCGSTEFILKGSMVAEAMRNIYLPPHYRIYIDLTFYRIDSWDSDQFLILVDGREVYKNAFTAVGGSQLCGDATNDEIVTISLQAEHTSNIIAIYLKVVDVNSDNNELWGFSLLALSIEPCPRGCIYCESNSWLQCKEWSLQFWDRTYVSSYHYQSNSNLYKFALCTSPCQYLKILPLHDKIMIRFRAYLTADMSFEVSIDNVIFTKTFIRTLALETAQVIEFTLLHTNSIIKIQITKISGVHVLQIKDFQLLIHKNDQQISLSKVECTNWIEQSQSCWECQPGWTVDPSNLQCLPICGDLVIVGEEECDDGNSIPYDGCHQCQFQCIMHCSSCLFGICEQCEDYYFLDIAKYECLPVCGDNNLVPYQEQCDDLNTVSGDSCYNCNFECTEHCLYCNSLMCFKCESGFRVKIGICFPICGDLIITYGQEDCDDGNDIPFDGCFNCQYQCEENCQQCQQGICLDVCPNGQVMLNSICQSICGDNIVSADEECDDGNTDPFDGCFNCKYYCWQDCQNCESGNCVDQCPIGQIMVNSSCQSVCGNNIVSVDEECDDGNDIPFDGCFNCKYSCSQNCDKCEKGLCLDGCKHGLIMINKSCQSFCGNNVVTEEEECDDGNQIQYDGCYQCQYSCPVFCQYCEAGMCLECLDNYKLSNNQCFTLEICGDGKIGGQEECDDGNQFTNDGCYNCLIEQNWICNSAILSECSVQEAPVILPQYLNQTLSIQYVQLTFSQEVKIISNIPLSLTMQITVSLLPNELFNITIYPDKEATTELSFAAYCISIEIYQILQEKPVLQVKLKQDIVNQYGISILDQEQLLTLKMSQYLTPYQKQATLQLLNFNQNIMLLLGVISFLALLMGQTLVWQEILNILQFIAILKFMNVILPVNLQIFFQISDLVSITTLLNFIGIDQYITQLPFQEVILASKGKFAEYQLNADLITNLLCQFLQFFILIIVVFLLKIYQKLLFKNLYISKCFYYSSQLASKTNQFFVFKIIQVIYLRIKELIRSSQASVGEAFTNLLLINSWDLLFKVFLFLYSTKCDKIRDYIQIALSIGIIVTYLKVILLSWSIWDGNHSNLKQSPNCTKYKIICLSRQIIFIMLLIFAEGNQVIQTILINVTNLSYFLLLQFNQNIKRYTSFIQRLTEGTILIFTISSMVYFEDFNDVFAEESKIIFGFAHMSVLSFALVVEVVKFIVTKGKIILSYVIEKITQRSQLKQSIVPASLFLN